MIIKNDKDTTNSELLNRIVNTLKIESEHLKKEKKKGKLKLKIRQFKKCMYFESKERKNNNIIVGLEIPDYSNLTDSVLEQIKKTFWMFSFR